MASPSSSAFLLIGLGNPGDEYVGTRHNVGFEVVDALSQNAAWKNNKRFHSHIIARTIADRGVTLAKPTTFMNESGRAATALVRSLRLTPYALRLLVVHDDLALPLGTLRLSDGGSSGGHKGVQSIIDALGSQDFLRLRIGIGPNTTPDGNRIPAEDFVLKRFEKKERPQVDAAVAKAVEVLAVLVRDGVDAAKRTLSISPPPPRTVLPFASARGGVRGGGAKRTGS